MAAHKAVIYKADNLVGLAPVKRLDKLNARIAGTVNDNGYLFFKARRRGVRHTFENPAGKLAADPDDEGGKRPIDQHDRARQADYARHQHDQRPDEHAERNGDINAHHAAMTDIAGNQPVESEIMKCDNTDQRRPGEQNGKLHIGGHVKRAKAQRHGRPQGEGKRQQIVDDQHGALNPARYIDQSCS